MKSKCKINDCDNIARTRGWCGKHYMRWLMNGSPDLMLRTPNGEPLQYLKNHMHEGCCQIWPYTKTGKGYPQIWWNGRVMPATQVVLELNNKPKPFPKAEVRHICGKGHLGCFNLKCLRWGTCRENAGDRVTHGSNPAGERHGRSKLTENQIYWARKVAGNLTLQEIADQLNCSVFNIKSILRRRTWKHI